MYEISISRFERDESICVCRELARRNIKYIQVCNPTFVENSSMLTELYDKYIYVILICTFISSGSYLENDVSSSIFVSFLRSRLCKK